MLAALQQAQSALRSPTIKVKQAAHLTATPIKLSASACAGFVLKEYRRMDRDSAW
jgi:hypothetical protein